jgi:hypothetical protein
MDVLLESPWPALLIGGLVTAILASGWLQTGRQSLLYAMLAAIVLTLAAVGVERLVVSDREQVDMTLHEIARLVEGNDISHALEYVHSAKQAVRAEAAYELPRYKFQQVSIAHNLEIQVEPRHLPPKATAAFNAIVKLGFADGSWSDQTVVRFVRVTFLQETDGRWRVAGYEHHDPRQGLLDENPGLAPPSAPRARSGK